MHATVPILLATSPTRRRRAVWRRKRALGEDWSDVLQRTLGEALDDDWGGVMSKEEDSKEDAKEDKKE